MKCVQCSKSRTGFKLEISKPKLLDVCSRYLELHVTLSPVSHKDS